MKFILNPGQLSLSDFRVLLNENTTLELHANCIPNIHASEKIITDTIAEGNTVYGVNTGFGVLANTRINTADLQTLQRSIVLSHAAGTGELFNDLIVRLILVLKINSLARGFSGVKMQTIDALILLFNAKIYPCIPSQGSVGASGDLAPLAHLSTVLIGVGEARYNGKIISAKEALAKINLKPLKLAPKEGLALLNGTQASTALAILGLLASEDIFVSAITAGALSVDATKGSDTPFDERIQAVRGHIAQIKVAQMIRNLLEKSEIRESHRHCIKVQDPYSLRCQPQVMGACLSHLWHASETVLIESNAVSDNPLVFTAQNEIISGGNFHAEPIALAADSLAISIAEISALSERRIALLVDPHFSGLPAFLVNNPGVNSGFMIAQVTAAALASENKSLAHPASIDSLPTSANQEDHVSMATYAARRLLPMTENAAGIIGIELLAACQGIDFAQPLKTSPKLEKVYQFIREKITFYEADRYFAPDIASAKSFIQSGKIRELVEISIL
ncbi:MAG: histidine ammonia-lyase [Gammaproteobacteria bacterium]|nr:histidine ammonia-lyase [Gammaproteobacteria bacterium]MCW5583028.1 histidine ammonia-lyase [Gammaproteobacteria bacterium]